VAQKKVIIFFGGVSLVFGLSQIFFAVERRCELCCVRQVAAHSQ